MLHPGSEIIAHTSRRWPCSLCRRIFRGNGRTVFGRWRCSLDFRRLFRLVVQLGRRRDHTLAFRLRFFFCNFAIFLLVSRVFFRFGERGLGCVFGRGEVALVFFANRLFDVRFGDMLGKSGGLVVAEVRGSVMFFHRFGLVELVRYVVVALFVFPVFFVNGQGVRRFQALDAGAIASLPL